MWHFLIGGRITVWRFLIGGQKTVWRFLIIGGKTVRRFLIGGRKTVWHFLIGGQYKSADSPMSALSLGSPSGPNTTPCAATLSRPSGIYLEENLLTIDVIKMLKDDNVVQST